MNKTVTKLATNHDVATLAEALWLRLSNEGMSVPGEPGFVLRDLATVGMAAKGLRSSDAARRMARQSLRDLTEWPDSTAQRTETAALLREVLYLCKPGTPEHTRIGSQVRILEGTSKIPADALTDWARDL